MNFITKTIENDEEYLRQRSEEVAEGLIRSTIGPPTASSAPIKALLSDDIVTPNLRTPLGTLACIVRIILGVRSAVPLFGLSGITIGCSVNTFDEEIY